MINLFGLISFFLLTSSSFAIETKYLLKTEISSGVKKEHYDYNLDGKVDLIESYKNDTLIKKELDHDYDGIFDESIEIFPYISEKKPIKVITKKRRVEKIYRHEKLKIFITTINIDNDEDGVFEKSITYHTPLIQKADSPCNKPPLITSISLKKFANDISAVTKKINGNFFETESGYRIHQSCLDKWGATKFTEMFLNSISSGLTCLNDLAEKNKIINPKATNGALNNLVDLSRLLSTNKVSVICHENNHNWNRVIAHASTSQDENIADLGVIHPFISINPKYPQTNPLTQEESELMSQTFFHEQFHNLGILHGTGIEYAYACEACCQPSSADSKEAIQSACKICSGQYDVANHSNKEYLKDLVQWAELTSNSSQSSREALNYQKENPKNLWGLTMYVRASASGLNPVGIELAKIISSKFPKITSEEKSNINAALKFKDNSDELHKSAPIAQILAKAHIALYFEDNPKAAIAFLESNTALFNEVVHKNRQGNFSNGIDNYIYDNLQKKLSSILLDIAFKNYPTKIADPISQRAFALQEKLDL